MKILKISILIAFLFPQISQAQFVLNGNALDEGEGCFTITEASKNQAGSIWYLNRADLNQDFSVQFQLYLGCDNDGADGMAFVMQPLGTGVGSSGGGIGYYGISPSLAIEFDTWRNAGSNDPSFDHLAVMKNGVIDHNAPEGLVPPTRILSDTHSVASDCNYHDVNIYWEAGLKKLSIYVDCEIRALYEGDIVKEIFGDNPDVYVGFTASTGNETNNHKLCFDYLTTKDSLPDFKVCEREATQVKAKRGFSTYEWFPSQGVSNTKRYNPYFTPNKSRSYHVAMKDQCGLVTKDSFYFEVIPRPLPKFSFDFENLTVNFRSDSNNVNTWYWDFGDRSPANNTQNPSHEYVQEGEYVVTLIITSDCGADTVNFTITLDGKSGEGGNTTGIYSHNGQNVTPISNFPNPLEMGNNINLTGITSGSYDLIVFDQLGRQLVLKNDLKFNASINTIKSEDLEIVNPGIYYLQLMGEDHKYSTTVIVQ
ncbi:MAG: hypothetical protein ACJATA_001315 [Sphingobacteriales bacterium]|jgi:hypothetical protein